MLDRLHKDNKGFTIIEVLIVLAIAGLIMLIVFLAIPALQRNQRNSARTSDASRVVTAVSECLSNRNGQTASCDTLALNATTGVPTAASELQPGTLNQLTGGSAGTNPTQNATTVRIQFGTGNGGCNAAGDGTGPGTSARSFSVLYVLETNVVRCLAG